MALCASRSSCASRGVSAVAAPGRSASRPKLRFFPSRRLARRRASRRCASQLPRMTEMTQMLFPSSGTPSLRSRRGMGRGRTTRMRRKSTAAFTSSDTGRSSSAASQRLPREKEMQRLIKRVSRTFAAIYSAAPHLPGSRSSRKPTWRFSACDFSMSPEARVYSSTSRRAAIISRRRRYSAFVSRSILE